MPENGINIVYGIIALIATIMMFIPKKRTDETPVNLVTFHKPAASLLAFLVGIGAGIVGAGGAFLLVPIMLVVLKIPTRMTIASSLAITLISSIGATIGKVTTGQFDYLPAFILILASLIAAPLGAKSGQKMNTNVLQTILAVLILGTTIKIWFDIF